MAATLEPLLSNPEQKRKYYENCPGCKQDKKNEQNTGIPFKDFLFIWVAALCSALPISFLFPFIYFMIRDLHIAETAEDIGFYAGFVGSSFMLGRVLTSILWGIIADRYGRKPVIVTSIISVIIFNTLFGFSTNFWMAVCTRLLLGIFSGILGPIKAYATEVCRNEYKALGLSVVSTSRGIGLIIGPAIGGYLSQPAEKFPDIITKESLLGKFPYLLPCLCISLFAAGAFIACFWLPETLHMHGNEVRTVEASLHDEVDLEKSSNTTDGKETTSNKSILRNWPLISAIIVYCVFSLHDTAYSEIFPMWAESDKSYGGLSFTSNDVGDVLAISGFSLLIYQLLFYPPFERALGPINSSRAAAVVSLPLLACYPFMTKLSGFPLKLAVNTASLLKNIFSITIITGFNLLQNNAVSQNQRGFSNGLSVTAMSVFKACGPASAGVLFSWAQKHQRAPVLPGDQMVFFVLNFTELMGLLLTFKPFLAIPSQENSS